MSKSAMVWATKYKLLSPISLKDGKWDKSGAKEEVHSKLMPRAFVEDRNAHDNNELYVIDEERTAELMKQREQSIVENNERAKRESLTQADLIEAIAGGIKSKEVKSSEPSESWSVKELKDYCKENEISFKGNPGKDKLLQLIYSNEEE